MSDFDLKSWLTGFALGMTGEPLPFAGRSLVAYLYNGALLPELPSDAKTHHYAVVFYQEKNPADSKPFAWLCLMDKPCVYQGSILSGYTLTGSAIIYKWIADEATIEWAGLLGLPEGMVANQWVYDRTKSGTDIVAFGTSGTWSNFDIFDKNGTVHFEGSAAIPVYE